MPRNTLNPSSYEALIYELNRLSANAPFAASLSVPVPLHQTLAFASESADTEFFTTQLDIQGYVERTLAFSTNSIVQQLMFPLGGAFPPADESQDPQSEDSCGESTVHFEPK